MEPADIESAITIRQPEYRNHGDISAARKIFVDTAVPDPSRPGRTSISTCIKSMQGSTRIERIISDFTPSIGVSGGKQLFLECDGIFYEDGSLEERGIKAGSHVEVVSLADNEARTKNEGTCLTLWSALPLILSISAMIVGFFGTFDIVYRGIFVLIGTAVGIPSLVSLVVGVHSLFSAFFKTSFIGDSWFSGCCSRAKSEYQ